MKCAFIGDIHARGTDLDRTAGALQQAMDLSIDCGMRILSGDLFDRFNVADREASVGTVYHHVINAIGRDCIAIIGNHDIAGAGQRDALEPLGEVLDVKREPELQITVDGTAILFIPWGKHPDEQLLDETGMGAWKNAKRRAIVAHCDIDGALTNTDRMMVGGSFSLDKNWIRSLNADIVALGHIHKRQDLKLGSVWGGYLGSLVQCNFGEGFCAVPGQEREHQPQGFLVWDTESNSIEWRNVQAARFWTVPTEWYADFHDQIPEGDRVKIKGKTRPAEMPAGVQFEPVLEADIRESRTTGIEADESPESLLQHWHSATQCKVDQVKLQDALKKILGQVQLPGSAIGSLERIDRISLQNIATHKDTDLDLSTLSGLIGISGQNGAGKTYAVESLYAALYGEFPSRPGTLADRVTRGFIGDAAIHAEFDSDGNHYRASRNIHRTAKTSKIEAFIYNGNGGIGEAIAGPKVADVTERSKSIVGDPSVLLATIFSAQGQIGNLIDAEPRDRKEHFAKLLGTDRLLVIGEKAKELLGSDERDAEYHERRITELELQLAGREQTETNLHDLETKRQPLETNLSKLNRETDDLKRRLADLQSIQKRRNDLKVDLERTEAEIAGLQLKIRDKQSLIEAAQERIEKGARLAAVASKRSEVENQLQDAEKAHGEAREQRLQLELQLANLRNEYQAIYNKMDSLAKSQTIEIERAISLVKDRIREIERKYESEESNWKSTIRSLETDLSNAAQRAALLDNGQFDHDICVTCPFTRDAFEAKGKIAGLEEDLKKAKLEMASLADRRYEELKVPTNNLSGLEQNLLAFDPKQWMQTDPACDEFRRQLAANRKAGLETKTKLESLPVPDDTNIRTLRAQLNNEIAPAERELAVIKEVEKSIESLQQLIAEYESTIEDLNKRKSNLSGELSALEIVDISSLENSIQDKLVLIEGNQHDLRILHQAIGQAQAELKRYEQIQVEIGKSKTDLETIRERSEQWTALQHAFSRDGIPQLIVDSAIPRLQQLLAELLSEFDNRWAIRLDTQRETKAGTVQERIDIRVIDANGEDDISAYSGGEKHLLRSILRIALGMLQAERSGKSLKVFMFDEAFDALDRENAIRLLAVFQHLLERFNQVFIVSHSDELLSVLPTQIRFNKINDVTTVEVIQ